MDAYAVVNIGDVFEPAQQFPTLGKLVSTLLPNIYMLAGVIFFLLLIFGGLGVIMGAGNQDPKKAEQGKQAITAALIGFLLIFLSYWIMQIIATITGVNIFNSAL